MGEGGSEHGSGAGDQRMSETGVVRSFRELRVYQAARDAAPELFLLTKRFPVEEKYSLTDQIRRASRSVHANIAEAWRKRRYPAAFVSKLSDADAEAAEVQSWLDSALDCDYINHQEFDKFDNRYNHIAAQLHLMMTNPDQWCLKSETSKPTAKPK